MYLQCQFRNYCEPFVKQKLIVSKKRIYYFCEDGMEQPVTHEEKWSSLGKIISEYDQEIPQSQTAAGLVMTNCDSWDRLI